MRPNQSILSPGQTEEVVILIVTEECKKFLEADTQKLDKHRFLVQSKVISDADYELINSLQLMQRGNEYQRIWNTGSKDDRTNIKLRVEFIYPKDHNVAAVKNGHDAIRSNGNNNSNNNNYNNSTLKAADETSVSSSIFDEHVNNSNNIPSDSTNTDNVYNDLQTLRKKFDAVVEYTVHLTADRDNVVAQLEKVKQELASRKNDSKQQQSRDNASSSSNKKNTNGINTATSSTSDKTKSTSNQFSLFFLFVATLIAFYFGTTFTGVNK